MGKLYQKSTLNLTRSLQIIVAVFSLAFSAIPPETSFNSFFWTKDANEDVQRGCYGHTKTGEYSKDAGGYLSTFWLTNYEWWQKLFVNTYITITVRTEQGQPSQVTRASGHFEDVEWLTGFTRNGSDDNIRFFFPLHSQAKPFGRYDYFTVDVNDTLDLEFYGAGDSIMVGTFVHKQPDERGAVNILGRNAIIVELTDANPLRINTIRCNGEYKSLLNTYFNYDLDKFAKDKEWYGISITDTNNVSPKLVVHSVNVENGDQLEANGSTTISWETNIPSEVDSCQILASYDNKKTWEIVGKIIGKSEFNWNIPNVSSKSAFIKVIAYNKSGENPSDISDMLNITPNIAVHSVTIGGETQLEADSTYAVSWEIDSPEDVDSCVISVSYDNKETWNKVGKTENNNEFNWLIPNLKEDSVYVKVTAYDKAGNIHSTISDMLTIIPEVVVTALQISDNNHVEADKTYEITWECNLQMEVNSYILDVTFDNKETWTNINTANDGTTFEWKVPNVLTDSAFIRVTAVCTDGMHVSEMTPALRVVPNVTINTLTVTESEKVKADSTYNIRWDVNFPTEVDTFMLSASFDNQKKWEKIGKTASKSEFEWIVPNELSDSVVIKIEAIDRNQRKLKAVSKLFGIIPEIVVDSFTIDGPSLLSADSSYNVKWKYNFPSEVDSSVLMASVDNMDSWDTLVVFDTRSGFRWKVPSMKADSVFLKVTVYGKKGQVAEAVADSMYAIDAVSTGILGRGRNLAPGFNTISVGQKLKINYTLPKGARKITLSIIDLKGRSINKVLNVNGYTAEVGSFKINKGMHSGYYYLRFRADYGDGKSPIVMTKKWLKLN